MAGPQLFAVTFDAALHVGVGFGDVVVVDALGELRCHAKAAVALVEIAAQTAVVDPVLHKNALWQAVDLAFAAGLAGIKTGAWLAADPGGLQFLRRLEAEVGAHHLDAAGGVHRVVVAVARINRKAV